MKKTRKIIAILLTVLTLMSVISAATPVFAAEMTETTETENAETTTENTETTGTEETKSTTDEPKILNEMVEWRTESTKYFRNSDGSYTAAQYAYPVHYEENGEWKEIDNTLTEETVKENLFDSENKFVARNTNTPATFPDEFKKDGSKQITVNAEGYDISFSPKESKNDFRTHKGNIKERDELESVKIVEKIGDELNGQATAFNITNTAEKKNKNPNNKDDKFKVKNKSGAVVYENVFNNVDLEYELNNSQIKESIILNEKQDTYIFEFVMDLGGLYPVFCQNGSINLCSDSEGKTPVAKIEAPYMVDSLGEYSDAVTMTIEQSGEEYVLTVTADENWLNDKARAYPVVIDPTINLNISRSDVIDNYVDDFDASESHPFAYHLYAGYSSLGKTRAYVKFNLPDLPNDNCIISNAFIVYYQASVDKSSTDGYLTIHKVTENWNNTDASLLPTWNKKPNFDDKALDYAKIQYNNGDEARAYQFDITKTVKEWYEGGTNYGLLLKSKDESVVNRVQLYSAENNYTNGYPAIYITFRDNKGLESYWSYSSYSIGAAGNAHINDYTGNLVYELPILSSISEIAPVTLTAYFNNYCAGEKLTAGKNGSSRTTLGKGFRLNIQQTVLPSTEYGLSGENATKYPYVYTDADGTEHYLFKETEDGKTVYKDEDGLGLTMTTDCDITATYQITDKAHNNYYFNTEGNLGIIADKNGNRITISFATPGENDNFRSKTRISKITDGAGHTFTFNYYTSTTGDYIASITDNAQRTITFNYSGGFLQEVLYYDGTKINIVYEDGGEGLINYIQSNDIYRVNFNYTSKATGRRVRSVTEYGVSGNTITKGQVVTFDRTKYNTTIIRSCGMDGKHYINDSSKGNDDIITTIQYDNMGRAISQQMKYGSGDEIGAGSCAYTTNNSDDTVSGFKNKVSESGSTGKFVENLLYGGNADSTAGWNYTKIGTIDSSEDTSTAHKYIGKKSIKLTATEIGSENARCYYRQNVSDIEAGADYTLSAYVKTDTLTAYSDADLTGVYIQIIAYDSSGASIANANPRSQLLTEKTDTSANNGWRRLTTTITAPSNASSLRCYLALRNVTGTVYFDCIQLEKSSTANDYNMLENSSFEDFSANAPSSWEERGTLTISTGSTVSNGVTTTKNIKNKNTNALKITGEPDEYRGMGQTVYVQGNPQDTYILSGWAKGYPVNSTFHTSGSGDNLTYNAQFEIAARVTYTKTDADGNTSTVTQYKESAKFNTTITDWQCSSTPIVLKYTDGESGCTYTPTSILIMPRYNKQENYVFFDNIMLVKDAASSYTYDDEGNLLSASANSEQKSSMNYDDDNNNLTSYKDTAGYTTKMTYDEKNNLQTIKSEKGVGTEYTYNDNGLYRNTEVHDGGLSINSNKSDYVAPTKAIRTAQSYFADDSSTVINEGAFVNAVYDENKKSTRFTYDYNSGQILTAKNPEGVVTTNTYTGNYSKLSSTTIGNSRVYYNYSDANRLNYIKFGKYSDGAFDSTRYEKYSFVYDIFGNIQQTKVGSKPLSTNVYDNNNGELLSTTYGNGDSRSFKYNNLGQKTEVYGKDIGSTSEAEELLYSWTYNDSGVGLIHTDHLNGLKYIGDYDSIGRISKEEVQNSSNSEYIGSSEYGYDVRNNLTNLITNYGGKSRNQRYYYSAVDESSNSAKYAKDNLPTMYKLYASRYAIYKYDDINRLTQRELTTDKHLFYNYTYRSSLRNVDGETKYTTSQIQDEYIGDDVYIYDYDVLGNITSIKTATRTSAGTGTLGYGTAQDYVTYSYDDLGQLKEIVDYSDDLVKEFTELNYDALGNITKKWVYTRSKADKGEVYDIKDVTYNYGVDPDSDGDGASEAGWNRLLTSVTTINYIDGVAQEPETENIDYDEIGNPTTYLGAILTWNGRQLTGYGKDNTSDLYTYDANGLRASKTVAKMGKTTVGGIEIPCVEEQTETKYYYVNGNLHYEERSDGKKLYFYYDSNGYLTSIEYNNINYYTATNKRGDVVAIYDRFGNCVAKYEYDAWGNILAITDANGIEITDQTHIAHINPIRYRGYYYDSETKLYYLQSRYYNPEIGRFLNADKLVSGIGGSLLGNNLYTYCFNNPTNASDSTGHWTGFDDLIAATVGAVAGVVSQFLGDVVTSVVNKKWETSNWQTYVGAAVGGAAGGVAALYSGPMCSAFISGAVSSFVGQSLEKITSETTTSFTTITENSIYAGIDCAAISFIIPTPQSNYIKGFQLEFDNSMVNIANRTTKEMSLSTFGKGMLSSVYTDTGSALLESSIQNFATSYEDENVIEIIS